MKTIKTKAPGLVSIVEIPSTEKIPTFYCNQVRMALSQFDLAIEVGEGLFGKATQDKEGQATLPVEFKARIVMSIQHAKAFLIALSQAVTNYEKDFGEIVLQPKAQK